MDLEESQQNADNGGLQLAQATTILLHRMTRLHKKTISLNYIIIYIAKCQFHGNGNAFYNLSTTYIWYGMFKLQNSGNIAFMQYNYFVKCFTRNENNLTP